MAQLAISAAGAAAGFAVGGPVGAQVGWAAGSIAGGLLFPKKQEVPGVGDLRAPAVQYGTPLIRLYGNNKTAGTLAWYSPKRVIPGDGGGKGEPSPATADTAEIDLLYILGIDSTVSAIGRVWKNGELIYTARSDSSVDSIIASTESDSWTALYFLDGNAAQLPHAVIEATEGVGLAPAYRHRQCVLIEGAKLGQSGQIPVYEFEVFEAVTTVPNFTEDFEDGIGDYSGTFIDAGFRLEATPWGQGLVGIGGFESAVESTLYLDLPTAVPLEYVRFDVKVNFRSGADGEDDGPIIRFKDGGTDVLVFDPVREKFYDIHQQPMLNGTLFGGVPLGEGVWYRFEWRWVSASDSAMTLTNLATGAVFGTVDTSGITAHNCTRLHFETTSSPVAGTLPEAVYDNVIIGAQSVTPATVDLRDIVEAEWARVADAADLDASALDAIPVRGFQAAASPRAALEALGEVFHFGAVCSDKLYTRLLGGASVATLSAGELAAGEDAPADEPFAPEKTNDEEIAERVALTYPNISDDYANGTETGYRASGSSIVAAYQTNVVMTPGEAKKVAEVAAMLLGTSNVRGVVSLSDYRAALEPTDPILVPDAEGTLYRMRITRETYGRGVREFELVRDDVNALDAEGITTDDYTPSLIVASPPDSTALLLDIPLLRDEDDATGIGPGFYAVVKGSSHGATLFKSADDVTFASVATFTLESVFGPCSGTLGAWGEGGKFDERSSLTVDVGDGELSSVTRAALLLDKSINACAIGVDGAWEICQFRDAELNSDGTYTLTGFLRGRRGTEWMCNAHVAGEWFVLLTGTARRVGAETGELGVSEYYRAVSYGRLLSTAISQAFTDNGIAQKPFALVHVRALHEATGDATITWTRRTRKSTRFASPLGIACPLGEVSEAYQIDVLDGADIVRTISTTEPSATYTAAQQTADGLTPGDPVALRVYQINEIIGRGYAFEGTL